MIHRSQFFVYVQGKLKSTPCRDQRSANNILRGTTAYVWFHKGRFGWSARKAESYGFRTPKEALCDLLEYFKEGGY